MGSGGLVAVIALVGAALVMFVFAYLIGVREMTGLISGHQQGTARDEQGLARWVGAWLAAMGLCPLVFAALFPFAVSTGQVRLWAIALCVVGSMGAIPIMLGTRKYL
jgi:hypothetical protein